MSISSQIRRLAADGKAVADIARTLGIRYQHAYNVLKADRARSPDDASPLVPVDTPSTTPKENASSKPKLLVKELLESGFVLSGHWILADDGKLIVDRPLPKPVGVYAFVKDRFALYVGVATMGLAKRLYFYAKPGSTQRTSQRINALLRDELKILPHIEIYTATPPDLDWNGLPVHGSAGLELGLIKKHYLPWNMRSAG